jgi:hypothetical protein
MPAGVEDSQNSFFVLVFWDSLQLLPYRDPLSEQFTTESETYRISSYVSNSGADLFTIRMPPSVPEVLRTPDRDEPHKQINMSPKMIVFMLCVN